MVAKLGTQLHQLELIHLGEGLAWIDAEGASHGPVKATPSLALVASRRYLSAESLKAAQVAVIDEKEVLPEVAAASSCWWMADVVPKR